LVWVYALAYVGGCLFDILHMELSLVLSSAVLIGMGCAAVAFSITSSLRSRALRRLPADLFPRMFSKTYNVFEPNEKPRRIIGNHAGLAVFFAVYGSWIAVTFSVFKAFELGGILSCIIFVLCAGLLMIDETFELNKNASVLLSAVKDGKDLAKGDVEVLKLVKLSLPRLRTYHLLLGVVFLASAFAIQEIVEAAFLASAGIASLVFALSVSMKTLPMLSFLVVAGLSGTVLVLFQLLGNRAKKRIFGFPPSVPVDILGRQFFRMKMYVGVQHHHPFLHEPSPEETEKANKRDVEEHKES
jgi:hypothetical protein